MVTAYGFVLQGIGTLMSIVFREILMGEDMHEYLADVLWYIYKKGIRFFLFASFVDFIGAFNAAYFFDGKSAARKSSNF